MNINTSSAPPIFFLVQFFSFHVLLGFQPHGFNFKTMFLNLLNRSRWQNSMVCYFVWPVWQEVGKHGVLHKDLNYGILPCLSNMASYAVNPKNGEFAVVLLPIKGWMISPQFKPSNLQICNHRLVAVCLQGFNRDLLCANFARLCHTVWCWTQKFAATELDMRCQFDVGLMEIAQQTWVAYVIVRVLAFLLIYLHATVGLMCSL